jgi:uncharacterized membrane protein YjjB (DUF3815 family)
VALSGRDIVKTVLLLLACFVATSCFAMLFSIPRRAVPYCGLLGAFAYLVVLAASHYGAGPVAAVFLGSLIVGTLSETLARLLKMPAIVFTTAGIIPLAPGARAYYTMYYFSLGDYTQALANASMVLYVASAISAGLAIGSILRRR